MPNRIIKESIWASDKISSLSDFEFRVWIALITLADDAGRGDARAAIIRGRAFPLRDGVTNRNVESAVRKLASNGCIALYTVGGHCYYCFPTWNRHQRIRDCKPKYPGPEDADDLPENDSPPQSAATCGKPPQTAALIQSESNPNTNPKEGRAEPQAASAPPVILLPLQNGTEYPVTVEQCHEWAGLYPAVDVIQQLRGMRGWLDANPTKRKTARGIKAFIVRWLAREQDNPRNKGNNRHERDRCDHPETQGDAYCVGTDL